MQKQPNSAKINTIIFTKIYFTILSYKNQYLNVN